MATVTMRVGGFEDEQVVFTIDYDDVTLNCLLLRCVNLTALPAIGTAARAGGGPSYSQSFPPGTTTLAIPTGAAQRIRLALFRAGKLSGLDGWFSWPT